MDKYHEIQGKKVSLKVIDNASLIASHTGSIAQENDIYVDHIESQNTQDDYIVNNGNIEGVEPGANNQDPIQAMTKDYKTIMIRQYSKWPTTTIKEQCLDIYNEVKLKGTFNVIGARREVNSLLKYSNWEKYTTGHSDDNWIVQLVRFGFPLQYVGPPVEQKEIVDNHTSARQHMKHVDSFIKTEIQNLTLLGPFNKIPFTWANVAPIMTRPKSNPLKRRIIVDYSFPEGGVNKFISKNNVFGLDITHRLPTVQQAIRVILDKPYKVAMATIDLERAYRNFRVDPIDWPLTCIRVNQQYYIDSAVPFGSRTSSLYMQKMAEYIQRATLHYLGVEMIMYLDDGLLILESEKAPNEGLQKVISLIRELGLPIAYDKIQTPSRRCRFLGIIIDLDTMCVEIPKEKIESFSQTIKEVTGKRFITKKQLQSIIGSINHLSKAVEGARLFMNRLLAALRESEGDLVRVDHDIKSDLQWFEKFLPTFNGKAIINTGKVSKTIEVDSCLIGGGGADGRSCYMYKYPEGMTESFHISQLEAINCLIGIKALTGPQQANSVVIVECDNLGAVYVLQNSKGRDRVINAVARAIWFFACKNNIIFNYKHKPGILMNIPDTLSRAYLDKQSMIKAKKIVYENEFQLVDIKPSYHNFNDYL